MQKHYEKQFAPTSLGEGFTAQEGATDHLVDLIGKILDLAIESGVTAATAAGQLRQRIADLLIGNNEIIEAGTFDKQTLLFLIVPAIIAIIRYLATR